MFKKMLFRLAWIFCAVSLAACAGSSSAQPSSVPATITPAALTSTPAPTLAPLATQTALASTPLPASGGFTLTSPDLPQDGRLPSEYTCDGASSSLALVWSGAPEGTQTFAVVMHHVASPEDIHWYWVVYGIPANVTSLAKNSSGVGTLGTNSVNGKQAYTPPCSKGPGDKSYTYTVYALSAQPQFSVPASKVTRAVLLDSIQGITLASAELKVVYARLGQ